MDNIHTYYDILMVSRNASQEVIRAAFKSLCQKYHPDRNSHPNAERIIQQCNEAYSILSNSVERTKYDKQLLDYEKKVNHTYREKSYSQFQDESSSGTPERKNNTVVINIPDSISLSGIKTKFRNSSFNIPDSTKSNIKGFSDLIAKIMIAIVITFISLIAILLIYEYYIDNSNSSNAAYDISVAQQGVQDAQDELNEAALYSDEYPDYSYEADTPESLYNDTSEVQQVSTPNHVTHAPNGQLFPSSAGYVAGYPQLNNNGASKLTIDNSQNAEAIFGKLYYLDSIEPQAVRHFYIQGGGGFNLRNISAGNYDVRYKDIENGSISKSERMLIEEYEDYDGIRFSNISMTLYKVSNGNMETYSIPESEF